MSSYLIKRNVDFTNNGFIKKSNSKNKGFIETRISNIQTTPLPKGFKVDDTIYVAENQIGIYAMGSVKEINNPHHILRINEFMKLIEKKGDEVYWMSRLKKYFNNTKDLEKTSKFLNVQEYFIDQKLLERTIPLSGVLERLSVQGLASSIIKLSEEEVAFINNPKFIATSEFKSDIPSSLRMDIYAYVNRSYSVQHFIDIDHLVPRSVNGPGNIIENLVPIGLGINRYKSDDVPIGFFLVAKEYGLSKMFNENYIKDINKLYITRKKKDDSDNEQKDGKFLEEARDIIEYVKNKYSVEDVKRFFRKILEYHYPEYAKTISDFMKSYS